MEKNNTEIVFIIDKSGSMSGMESDTIGGFNSMIKKHKSEEGTCHVSTVLFSTDSEVIHNRVNIQNIEPMTDKDYIPGGCTALLDAVGNAINHTVQVQKLAAEDEKADHVIFIIITDGYENASREYSQKQIKKMISYEKEKYNWEFVFLGANIDAVQTAESYGISADRAENFHCDSKGIACCFAALDNFVTSTRKGKSVGSWNNNLRKDYESRK